MDCLIIDAKINDDTGILHPKQYDCRKFMEIFKKMYDVNSDKETRKMIYCYIIGLNKMTIR